MHMLEIIISVYTGLHNSKTSCYRPPSLVDQSNMFKKLKLLFILR